MEPLSPPETKSPLSFMESVLMMVLCPERFCMKLPLGKAHFLMLSAAPETNENSRLWTDGWSRSSRVRFAPRYSYRFRASCQEKARTIKRLGSGFQPS